MDVSTSPKTTIGPGVQEFLRQNSAEASFQTICDLIRECFPETLAIEVELKEDHYEQGWWRVFILFTLPAADPLDRVLERQRLFSERLVKRIPLAQIPLFIALNTYAAE